MDGDGLADASDLDRDGDGVADVIDNCVDVPNGVQADFDGDAQGNSCDGDDGEIQGLRFADAARAIWEPEQGATSFNVYRGDLGAEGLLSLAACKVSSLSTRYDVDADLPVPGDGYFHLVSGESGPGEGTPGRKSSGVERTLQQLCPLLSYGLFGAPGRTHVTCGELGGSGWRSRLAPMLVSWHCCGGCPARASGLGCQTSGAKALAERCSPRA